VFRGKEVNSMITLPAGETPKQIKDQISKKKIQKIQMFWNLE
jgi:hypothetical protein